MDDSIEFRVLWERQRRWAGSTCIEAESNVQVRFKPCAIGTLPDPSRGATASRGSNVGREFRIFPGYPESYGPRREARGHGSLETTPAAEEILS